VVELTGVCSLLQKTKKRIKDMNEKQL